MIAPARRRASGDGDPTRDVVAGYAELRNDTQGVPITKFSARSGDDERAVGLVATRSTGG